jgi:hypothetical protein
MQMEGEKHHSRHRIKDRGKMNYPAAELRSIFISPPLRGGVEATLSEDSHRDEGEGEKRTQSPPPNLLPQGGGI